MDTETVQIFTDSIAEFANIQSPTPSIDLTDTPLQPSLIQPFDQSPNFYVTSAISEHAYYDIQFLLANNFWGCNFNFGNSTCGVQIRQGTAHMIDRAEFVANDPIIQGQATAIDNPVPPNNGGLPAPNPCAWDASFPESGSNCIVGAPGGTSYHLTAGAGANGISWLQAPGSTDLDAAAAHFVAAGIATGCDGGTGTASCIGSTDSRLSGISSAATANPVNFFIRNDDTARLDLGNGLSEQICYLFTGSYTTPCPYLTITRGPITTFPGFCTGCCGGPTCTTTVNLNWGMYTGAFSDVFPFDASLFFTYNSQFVSGIPSIIAPNGPCSAAATPSSNAANYMFLCSPVYDSISNQMEFAPCLSATGDPAPGSPNNGPGADCPNTTQLSAISAGVQTEDVYGRGAYSIPVFDRTADQFGYLSNWQRVINGDGVGIPNYFTWLDAYSPNPAVPGTVRQGFSETTRSLSPYVAETNHDFYTLGNIYDSVMIPNPLSNGQLMDWMIVSVTTNPLSNVQLTYVPPPGTQDSFRLTLRSDMFFQDGRKVTSFDVAFSYLSLMATGAFQSVSLAPITGITILGSNQFDVNVNAAGPFTLNYLTSPTIMPGRYWTNAGASSWDAGIGTCTSMGATCYPAQYTLTTRAGPAACALTCTFSASLMNPNPAQIGVTYDPIASHTLVGSGPFTCGTVTSSGSGSCSSTGQENPPEGSSYTLTRFGKGLIPASSISSLYSRSNGNLALWTWSLDTGDVTHDFLNYSIIARCFGTTSPNCSHWMMGIGGCGGTLTSPCTIGLQQVAIINRFVGLNWVAPYNWQSSPPAGIIPFAPVLYEGGYTLNPASIAGCTSPFPTGGYEC